MIVEIIENNVSGPLSSKESCTVVSARVRVLKASENLLWTVGEREGGGRGGRGGGERREEGNKRGK